MNKKQTETSPLHLIGISVLLGGLLSPISSALESDKAQDLTWDADGDSRMSIVGENRIVQMSDNVRISQGTMKINGDEATIEYDINNNEIRKITVNGNPVHYQQQLDSDEGLVVGSSTTITFYTDEADGSNIVELIGEAVIESPNSNLMCSAIVYIADQDLIRKASGPCSGVLNPSTQ